MEILYYHSKAKDDPCAKGKRMTVACLVDNNKMVFGIAKTNHRDHFIRKVGRAVASGRLQEHPQLIIPVPEADLSTPENQKKFRSEIRKLFVDKARELVKDFLRSAKEIDLLRKLAGKGIVREMLPQSPSFHVL